MWLNKIRLHDPLLNSNSLLNTEVTSILRHPAERKPEHTKEKLKSYLGLLKALSNQLPMLSHRVTPVVFSRRIHFCCSNDLFSYTLRFEFRTAHCASRQLYAQNTTTSRTLPTGATYIMYIAHEVRPKAHSSVEVTAQSPSYDGVQIWRDSELGKVPCMLILYKTLQWF